MEIYKTNTYAASLVCKPFSNKFSEEVLEMRKRCCSCIL